MGTYNSDFQRLGDGYTYYKEYTPTTVSNPYGEPTIIEVMADDQTFGGTDPSGAEIAVEKEEFNVEISQEKAAVKRLIVGESATFKITIMASRLENLAIAAGRSTGDITNIGQAALPGGNSGKGLLIGGITEMAFFALVHEVCNSVSPNLKDWIYMPRCQASPSMAWTFAKNALRQVEFTANILPAKQDAFLISEACSTNHALFQVIYEYN